MVDTSKIKQPKPNMHLGKGTQREPYHTKTKEERAEQARINGAKTANLPRDGYLKAAPVKEPDPTEYDLYTDIYDPRAKYPPEIKIQAATCYMLTGTLAGASRMTGLRQETIWDWKNNSQWWDSILTKVRKEKQDELDAKLSGLIHEASQQIEDRILNGDEVLVKKSDGNHDFMNKKMSGKDLTTALGTLYDKRTMLRGDPTSITRRETPADMLNALRDEFANMAKAAAKAELNKTVVNN